MQTDPFVSRFILISDESTPQVAGFTLPDHWWSRPHEYAWSAKFTGPNLVAFDAACGVSHPFKWLLSMTCKDTWACDLDPRLTDPTLLRKEIADDLGQEQQFSSQMEKKVHLFLSSICNLPDSLPLVDRIFCISTLEHMTSSERKQALSEFARKLKPDGLLIITMDYPSVSLKEFFSSAKSAGLVRAGPVEATDPPPTALCSDTAIPNQRLFVYRSVFKRSNP